SALKSENIQFVEIGKKEALFMEVSNAEAHDHDGHHSDFDPHIWLDPLRMIEMAEMIEHELTEMYPEHSERFATNFAEVVDKLEKLDEQFVSLFAEKQQKQLLVSHAAFGYWEERYGLEQIAISGISSSDEPSQKELVHITTMAE